MIRIERQEWVIVKLSDGGGIVKIDFHNMQDDCSRSIRLNENTNKWERYYAIDAEWGDIGKGRKQNAMMHRAYKYWQDHQVDKVLLGVDE
jgi:hypothetical protein